MRQNPKRSSAILAGKRACVDIRRGKRYISVMENLKKLSLPLEEIFIERKWGAGLCAFVVYSMLFSVLSLAMCAISLFPNLYLVLTSQITVKLFFVFLLISSLFFGGAFFTGWSLYWFFKRKSVQFRAFYKISVFSHFLYIRGIFGYRGPMIVPLLLFVLLMVCACVLFRYINKSKALKRYFGEEEGAR